MGDTIIKVENLSKRFVITHEKNERYTALRDVMANQVKKWLGRSRNNQKATREDFWALQDLNFEINRGDRVGIVGRNGAGKSTLLKILSRITEPSTGRITIDGRVASLLEVGTGFHPELTGRENIFLNGAILGMSRAEIRAKFDEIVAFAEVEKFLDTPVKRYSSGMYVRLAFAVAAHLEPEILIVDEVLAVGDAQFQKKCLGKMEDVSRNGGRTVLFVSHNMAAVKSLCSHGMLLADGKLVQMGSVPDIVSEYLKGGSHLTNHKTLKEVGAEGVQVTEIKVSAAGKSPDEPITMDDAVEILTTIQVSKDAEKYNLTFHINDELGNTLFSFWDSGRMADLRNGDNLLKCLIPTPFFNSGTFYLSLLIVKNRNQAIHVERDIVSFHIHDREKALGSWMGREPGFIHPEFTWNNT